MMGTKDGNSLYLKEKLYYIDLNGAYMAAVKSIPKHIEDMPLGEAPTKDSRENTKIKELIEILYEFRMNAKRNGNDKLATTLKFLMNSCWGYSIQRPKLIKHKYTENVQKYIETYEPYVVKYKTNSELRIGDSLHREADNKSGYVTTINPFVQHFSYPQFAKSVLDEFNNIMNNIKNIVNVLYQNVDAILISESDYFKLVELGYIGDKLGQFKIEYIFSEIAIKSKKKYMGILAETGEVFYHCVKKEVKYEEFVRELLPSCN